MWYVQRDAHLSRNGKVSPCMCMCGGEGFSQTPVASVCADGQNTTGAHTEVQFPTAFTSAHATYLQGIHACSVHPPAGLLHVAAASEHVCACRSWKPLCFHMGDTIQSS